MPAATKPKESQRWSKACLAPFWRLYRLMFMNYQQNNPDLGRDLDIIGFTNLGPDLYLFLRLDFGRIVCFLILPGLRNGSFLDHLDLKFLVFNQLFELINLLDQIPNLRILPDISFYLFGDLVVDFNAQFPKRVVQGVINLHHI